MSKLEYDIDEIIAFLEAWKPDYSDLASDDHRSKIKSSYKQFHSLLIWRLVLDSDTSSDDQRLYTNEAVSDISHAFFLNLTSLYKSSRSSLRSGIENYMRAIAAYKGLNLLEIKSVFELFSAVRLSLQTDTVSISLLDKLKVSYGELCKSVHSSKVDYLSLSVPFDRLSSFDNKQFIDNNEKLREVSALSNQLSFWLWDAQLSSAGHENGDYVRDSIPRSLKRRRTDAISNNG